MPEADPANDTSGHRERLRRRLFEGGGNALLDHELVEYLLGLAIRRGDTKPLARRLLAEFGSYGALMQADPLSLARSGLGETTVAVLKIAQASALRLLAKGVEGRPVLASWQALTDYLHASMAHRATEAGRVLHLDTKNVLIRDETISEGTVDQAPIYIREIAKRALDLGSAAIILVHNHPSGDPAPSRQDIQLTKDLVQALRPLGIGLHDHIIVGSQGQSSLRSKGLI